MDDLASERVKTLLQILAVICAVLICSMVLHKGISDITILAHKHPGDGFWRALAEYLIRNLAGG